MWKKVLLLTLLSVPLWGLAPRSWHNTSAMIERIRALDGLPGVSVEEIGRSTDGRPVLAVKMAGEVNTRPVIIVGGTHPLEWPSYDVPMRLAESVARMQRKTPVIFVILFNPDGFEYQRIVPDRYEVGRKNRCYPEDVKDYRQYSRGVDLNRNFPVAWEKGNSSPSSVYYRGRAPLSEPEAKALVEFIRREKPKLFISFHTPGRRIQYPWSYSGAKDFPPEWVKLASELTGRIGYSYRYEQDYANSAKPGSEIDWFFSEMKGPAFRIEMGKNIDDMAIPEYSGLESAVKWLIQEWSWRNHEN